ncbi:MAG: hypothetical protein WCG93_03705 [Paludibacter sp.]
MKIQFKDANNQSVFDNLAEECYKCEEECFSEGCIVKCPVYTNEEIRQGKKKNNSGSLFFCATKDTAKTTKLFKEKLDLFLWAFPDIMKFKEKIGIGTKQFEQEKYEKIVHNLRTINAQSIQEQFSLVPQDFLSENYINQVEYITNIIKDNPEKAATVFLRLAKNNASVKTEFATHEKLSTDNPVLTKSNHDIRKVILNVFHAFSLEFKSKKVDLEIFQTKKKLNFDYDTVRLAIYHIFHNSAKYIKPKSKLKIDFIEEFNSILVIFHMHSIQIMEEEVLKIFEDNYSGIKVKEKKSQGSGLGMGLIRRALGLNNAIVEVRAGKNVERINKIDYTENTFIFKFYSTPL